MNDSVYRYDNGPRLITTGGSDSSAALPGVVELVAGLAGLVVARFTPDSLKMMPRPVLIRFPFT